MPAGVFSARKGRNSAELKPGKHSIRESGSEAPSPKFQTTIPRPDLESALRLYLDVRILFGAFGRYRPTGWRASKPSGMRAAVCQPGAQRSRPVTYGVVSSRSPAMMAKV